MAENRAAFSLRRFLALGFSNRRRSRNCCKVCSRSSFFFSRRMAFSTGSPFFSLTSVIIKSQFIAHNNLAWRAFQFGLAMPTLATHFASSDAEPPLDGFGQHAAEIKISLDTFLPRAHKTKYPLPTHHID